MEVFGSIVNFYNIFFDKMEFQFNLGQHSLLRTLNGELVHGVNNTFAVFDSAANKIIYRPAEEMALAVTLLSTKTMISKVPLPLASTSSSSHSSSKQKSEDHSSYSYSTSSPSSSSSPMSAFPLPLSSSEIWKKNSEQGLLFWE
ncbi:hypothetical protein FOCC_FOCC007301 [Frankliniella occidentalis]|nr:hypothetical protein FOCC_FOCC007301 [Frankliniella occidentalis]